MAKAPSAFIQEPVTLRFGTEELEVREVPIARTKLFVRVVAGVVGDYHNAMAEVRDAVSEGVTLTTMDHIETFTDIFYDRSYEVLAILIPDLPREPWDDVDDGVTLPQLRVAFNEVLRINGLEGLKKSVPFFQNLIQTTDLSSLLSSVTEKIAASPAFSRVLPFDETSSLTPIEESPEAS